MADGLPGTRIPRRYVNADGVSLIGELPRSRVFDTYWRFAAARQSAYQRRLLGEVPPWTTDATIARYRFTNCYRATDRVSQFLIRHVAYCGPREPAQLVFRILLFKFFNRISTWGALEREFGTISLASFEPRSWAEYLLELSLTRPIYSAAYVIPQPAMGAARKASNHLLLLARMVEENLSDKLLSCGSMKEAFDLLRSYSGIGDFLAYQFVIDLNYSTVLDFSEMDFVVAGPGARDGIAKCFGAAAVRNASQIIRYMSESQDEHFARLGLRFDRLGGKRPLTLVDCQNLFCETDKYTRATHPEVNGLSRRTRIKQLFRPTGSIPEPWFPPKWGVNARK
nr:nucleotide kinase domain-containing protein [Microlunatus sp. Gsoil 973]